MGAAEDGWGSQVNRFLGWVGGAKGNADQLQTPGEGGGVSWAREGNGGTGFRPRSSRPEMPLLHLVSQLCQLCPRCPPCARLLSSTFCLRAGQSNYYELLGIRPDASMQEVKRAFFAKSKELHPDRDPKNPALHHRFVELNEAYRVLSKACSRRAYDSQLRPRQPPPAASASASSSWSSADSRYWAQFHKVHPDDSRSARQRQQKQNHRVLGYCLLLMLGGMVLHYLAFRKLEQIHRRFMDEKDRVILALYNESRTRARSLPLPPVGGPRRRRPDRGRAWGRREVRCRESRPLGSAGSGAKIPRENGVFPRPRPGPPPAPGSPQPFSPLPRAGPTAPGSSRRDCRSPRAPRRLPGSDRRLPRAPPAVCNKILVTGCLAPPSCLLAGRCPSVPGALRPPPSSHVGASPRGQQPAGCPPRPAPPPRPGGEGGSAWLGHMSHPGSAPRSPGSPCPRRRLLLLLLLLLVGPRAAACIPRPRHGAPRAPAPASGLGRCGSPAGTMSPLLLAALLLLLPPLPPGAPAQ
ncbi:uncharacterized protein LOC100028411 isoform X2 [Monodelphis domestica]|uniref:uncharacterized protein LOC100028411 isoform X2 n=1 Tax=Monodelphis domestica TaxID=13616 RepID=UPI0024E21D50|nr:uncharacterized protein LOC100028411 isoform X2 [Monodelphis domestica]